MKSKVTNFSVPTVCVRVLRGRQPVLRHRLAGLRFGWLPIFAMLGAISWVGCEKSDSDSALDTESSVPDTESSAPNTESSAAPVISTPDNVQRTTNTSTSTTGPKSEPKPKPKSVEESPRPTSPASSAPASDVEEPIARSSRSSTTPAVAEKPAFNYDSADLAKRCRDAKLPPPPDLNKLDPGLASHLFELNDKAIRDGSASSFGQLGKLYAALAVSREETTRAIECLQRAKDLDPDAFEWPYYLAQLFLQRSSHVRARAELVQACALNPDYAMAHAWLGNISLRDNRLQDARKHYEKFVELMPDDAMGYTGLAVVELESGNLEEARRLLDRAFEVGPPNGWTYSISARHFAQLGETILSAQHKTLGQSLPLRSGVLVRDPLMLEQHLALGATQAAVSSLNMFATLGDLVSAGALSNTLMSAYPENFELLAGIAQVELFKGDVDRAIALAELANRIDSTSVYNILTLARAYLTDGRFDDALAAAERAIRLNPKAARAHRIKGKILLDMQRYEEAKAEFMLDFQLEPENPRSAKYIADIWRQLGDTSKSNQFYENALLALSLGDFPTSMTAPIYVGIAENHLLEGDADNAIVQYKRAITADPKNQIVFAKFIELLLRENQNDEALSYSVRAVNISPEIVAYQFIYAEVLERLGRSKEALDQIEKLRRVNPSNPSLYLLRGRILNNAGRSDQALESFERALDIDPKFEGAYVAIVELHLAKGDYPSLIKAARLGLTQVPSSIRLANTAAWVMATNSNESVRDPKEAIRLSEFTCTETKRAVASCLDTLACAYAADGRFDDARSTLIEAIDLARKNPSMAEEALTYEARLKLFEQGKPYLETKN